MSLHTLNIRLDFPYRTGFTHGAFRPENDALASLMEQRPGSRVLVLLEKGLEQFYPQLPADIDRYFEKNAGVLAYAGCRSVPGGEEAKTGFSAWETALRHIVEAGIDRHSYIIAVGGGAFLDVAGFAAATAHRGIRLLRIPTTTLSQADSGVGVKNGINFMGRKNYLGTFAVAWATLDDFLFLHSQPLPLKRAGLAEVVKVAVVKDASFFNWLETNASALAVCERDALEYAVEHSALLHASHIACGGDAFELGSSRPLDFGHWAAHYMETMSGYIPGARGGRFRGHVPGYPLFRPERMAACRGGGKNHLRAENPGTARIPPPAFPQDRKRRLRSAERSGGLPRTPRRSPDGTDAYRNRPGKRRP